MSTKTDYAFIALNVISWIIFIGLCFEAGAYLFNAFFTLFYNPFGAGKPAIFAAGQQASAARAGNFHRGG